MGSQMSSLIHLSQLYLSTRRRPKQTFSGFPRVHFSFLQFSALLCFFVFVVFLRKLPQIFKQLK